ncbi:MAG: hypothetical protein EXS05_23370 [Planctomycetaceae bacterium]|nr:hypothetical protein [Planctomycetaceae bacterium]
MLTSLEVVERAHQLRLLATLVEGFAQAMDDLEIPSVPFNYTARFDSGLRSAEMWLAYGLRRLQEWLGPRFNDALFSATNKTILKRYDDGLMPQGTGDEYISAERIIKRLVELSRKRKPKGTGTGTGRILRIGSDGVTSDSPLNEFMDAMVFMKKISEQEPKTAASAKAKKLTKSKSRKMKP